MRKGAMRVAAVLSLFALCLLTLSGAAEAYYNSTSGLIQVNNATKFFVSPDGRTRLFHGVNAVYKVPPWYPETDTFNTDTSLSQEDIDNLAGWGFNAVRLGMMWPGVNPQQGVVAQDYLDKMESIVNALGEAGIYTILDCHQDLFSRFFCGEGVPDWAVPQNSLLEFPEPIMNKDDLLYNPYTGYPNITSCHQTAFFEYYFTAAVGHAFQELYDNKKNLQTEFGSFWQAVATQFKDNDYVLGYELINEPWAGDIYEHPKALIEPGYADATFLYPMYQYLFNQISEIDDKHIIFFESAVSDVYPCGFPSSPGGPENATRQAYSYHVYCAPTNPSGDPTMPLLCNYTDDYIFDVKQYDHNRLGVAGFMTEFGAMEGTQEGVDSLDYLTGKADEKIQSWTYWEYKTYHDITTSSPDGAESFYVNGTLDTDKVRALSRTYARAIAGTPTVHFFDPVTAIFQVGFDLDVDVSNDITEIYYNAGYYYPNGYMITLSTGLEQVTAPEDYLIWVSNRNATNHALITIQPNIYY